MLKKISLVLFAAVLFTISAQAQSWQVHVNDYLGTPTYVSQTVSYSSGIDGHVSIYLIAKSLSGQATAGADVSVDGIGEERSITVSGREQRLDYNTASGYNASGYIYASYITAGVAIAGGDWVNN